MDVASTPKRGRAVDEVADSDGRGDLDPQGSDVAVEDAAACPALGDGWTQKLVQRKNGGRRDRHFVSPEGVTFRSLAAARRHLTTSERAEIAEGGAKDASPAHRHVSSPSSRASPSAGRGPLAPQMSESLNPANFVIGEKSTGGEGAKALRILASLSGWYFLSAVFAIMNKRTLSCFPHPWLTAWVQLAVGAALMPVMWKFGLVTPPEGGLTAEKFRALLPTSVFHLIGHVSACASFNLGSVSFMQVVKAAEPACAVVLLTLFFGKRYSALTWLTLVLIVGGVVASSSAEAGFSMASFVLAMTSNVASALRGATSKDVQRDLGLAGVNLYAAIAIVSAVLLLPVSLLLEGRDLIPALESAPTLLEEQGILLFGTWRVGFTSYLTVCALFYHFYNQTSYLALADLTPLSHSIANTLKRVVIIVASLVVFRNPITTQGAVSAAVAVGGTLLYSLAQQLEAKKTGEKKRL